MLRCRHTSIFLPILASISANIGSKKRANRHAITGVFAASFYRLWLLKTQLADQNKQDGQRLKTKYSTYRIKFVAVKPSYEEETYFHLFAYTDFQNCRRSSARSRTKTKIVNKDASIGSRNDDLWLLILAEKRQYW